ncbi:MAG: hypothetical protein B7X53_00190 [Hyphomonas sp. 34-62-18]|nr:hypothetical protein [Hyphomonas sp. 34-62-18]OZB19419.1 MAG: hypothetical protein B7X53_00190 [Hyphomonas sp. 34-62-18]
MRLKACLLAVAAGAFLAACQTAPAAPEPEPVAEQTPAVDVPPPPAADKPRVNEWGGEVPENKPAGDVDEGGLGDLS